MSTGTLVLLFVVNVLIWLGVGAAVARRGSYQPEPMSWEEITNLRGGGSSDPAEPRSTRPPLP
jgi:hypothetical protein